MTVAGKYIQFTGTSSNAWAIGSTGGNNAPLTASTTLGFHHYNGSAWNSEFELSSAGDISFVGRSRGGDGTAALPTYAFAADPNTGIFRAASDNLGFAAGGQQKAFLSTTQLSVMANVNPGASNTYDLGSTGSRWRNIYTNDLHLSNEDTGGNDIDGTEGNWTIQEGENDLFIINNKNGKKFKIALEEVT